MPVIRCPKCGQAYDVPGVVAVRLPNSIATCHCGEWLAGSKAAVLARMLDPAKIKEIDLQPYRIDGATADAKDAGFSPVDMPPPPSSSPRSIRVVALGADEPLDAIFTIGETPLLIGRRGAHIELAEASLSLRHCSIFLRGGTLVVRDANSHLGTFLDGKKIEEAVIGDGVHLLQVGTARLAVEPTEESGASVEPIPYQTIEADEHEILAAAESMQSEALQENPFASAEPDEPAPPTPAPERPFLICLEGPLSGQEFEIPPGGLTVGREGHVRVPDEFLSRRHFQVTPDATAEVRVKDLGSRNGTFLNTEPAQDSVVKPGDEIKAGVNRFRIERRA